MSASQQTDTPLPVNDHMTMVYSEQLAPFAANGEAGESCLTSGYYKPNRSVRTLSLLRRRPKPAFFRFNFFLSINQCGDMIECERGLSTVGIILDKLHSSSTSGSSGSGGISLERFGPSSYLSQLSDLSSSFTESLSINDTDDCDAASEQDLLEDDMVFANAGDFGGTGYFGETTSSLSSRFGGDGEMFEFEDAFELDGGGGLEDVAGIESDPETGSVQDMSKKPPFCRPMLVKSLSTSADDRYIHFNQYKLMDKTIGEGTTSIVKLAINRADNNRYAMKILSKTKLMKRAMLYKKASSPSQDPYREIAILRKLNHPNIVKLVDVLDDPEEDELYMVFELMEGGKVLDIPTRSPLSEKLARQYFRDILSGVEYLHLNRIIHRDLKPDNMLLDDDDTVKIADFGLSGEFVGADDQMATPNGTPAFTAPECLDPDKTNYSGQAIDMWSLGVTLFAMLYGDVPFKDENVYRLYERVRNDEVAFPAYPEVSAECKDLINKLLDKNPARRLSMLGAFSHAWVSSHGKDPLTTRRGSLVPVPEDLTTEEVQECIHKVPKVKRFILIKKMISSNLTGYILSRRKRRLSANSESDSLSTSFTAASSTPSNGGGTPTSPFRRGSISTHSRLLKRKKKSDVLTVVTSPRK
ncbi:Calcium/calmodulin-dependent protein kinase kinase [Hypsibius exemplaris]|uniref:Calcium/calmodulin-dependent protein kinase kinase n=1 Tax=Hypsibius exemplaris TaxID=2072580 RepID=A0A1W0XFJ1_HYPEX|nr:Calcium/calmodulin-dependent protein kinase kinase [Hypsibius exemplaris]